MQRYSLVFSNVPGPAAPVHLCGRPVVGLLALYPNLVMQGLCVSYAGTMWMNFVVDPDVVAPPARCNCRPGLRHSPTSR